MIDTTHHAAGGFDVTMAPTNHAPDEGVSSFSLEKQYHGDLEGAAKGEMLSAGDPKSGNAGYVAIEKVTGRLADKAGSFALMHSGTMAAGTTPQLSVVIVPGSGTGELSGIFGVLTISKVEGKHTYTLDYGFSSR
jgi:Protein of unknown function (DUF3224)